MADKNGVAFQLNYHMGRMLVCLALYAGMAATLTFYLLGDFEKTLPVWALALISAIFCWQAVRLVLILVSSRGPILTMDSDGIDIAYPAIGRVAWEHVEGIDLGSGLLSRNIMTVFFDKPPVEKPGHVWLYYPLAKALLNDPATFQLNLFVTDARVPDVQEALNRLWPGAEPEVKYRG